MDSVLDSPGRRLDSSSELEAPRPFGARAPTGPGARRFSAPERRACWLFGAPGVTILRGRGAESFGMPSSPDAPSGLRRSISVAVAFGWRRWRPRGEVMLRLTLASTLLRQGSSDPRLGGRLLVQPCELEVERLVSISVSATEPRLGRRRPGPIPATPFGERPGATSGCRLVSREPLFVSRGPSGLGDAGEDQPVRAGEQVSFGMLARKCGLVREAGARRAPRWSGHIGPAAFRGGRAGWSTPSRSLVEAALDGGFGDPVAALRGSWLERRF